eukprot:gene6010-biopygen8768
MRGPAQRRPAVLPLPSRVARCAATKVAHPPRPPCVHGPHQTWPFASHACSVCGARGPLSWHLLLLGLKHTVQAPHLLGVGGAGGVGGDGPGASGMSFRRVADQAVSKVEIRGVQKLPFKQCGHSDSVAIQTGGYNVY